MKSGVCPRTTGASTTVCNTNCQIDYDCHGIKKCCQVNACSTRCTRPVLVDVGGSGSSTIFELDLPLFPNNDAVPILFPPCVRRLPLLLVFIILFEDSTLIVSCPPTFQRIK
jgi:hypothetical protein